jgi:flagellar biosynthesis anti-sigma factor FlgM
MRIGDYSKLAPAPVDSTRKGAATTQAKDSTGGASTEGAASGEKVTVSAEALRLADQAAAGGDSKVETLRAAISNGTFKIDKPLIATRIADGE